MKKKVSETISTSPKMLGIVTLYKPHIEEAAENILRYLPSIEQLIVWDNSSSASNVQQQLMPLLGDEATKVVWCGTGENRFIAQAINHAWHYAQDEGYDLLLIMDQDSRWEDFAGYRQHIENVWEHTHTWVFTPYVSGHDTWVTKQSICFRRLFINSGTVIPVEILTAIGGADERFPLDSLDHDLSVRIHQAKCSIACLTASVLHHQIGSPIHVKGTPYSYDNYSSERIYLVVRSHLLFYRKHRQWLTFKEKKHLLKDELLIRPLFILYAASGKWPKLKSYLHGLRDGIRQPL